MKRSIIEKRSIRIAVVMAMLSTTVLFGLASPASAAGNGATQIAGVTDGDTCSDGPDQWAAADYSFHLTGDLEGCVYGVITTARCHPSGTYQEVADEIFVDDDDDDNTFQMTEFFWAKYVFDGEPCVPENVTAQLFGGCKHPIVAGSGTGKYDGVSGRLDFKDNVDDGTADYRGHLKGI